MAVLADILMSAGAFAAAIYCYVLAGRLKKFQTLEGGMGGAIAVLSAQVDDMTGALEKARDAARGSADGLEALTERAEAVATRLELIIASMHDIPEPVSENDRVHPAEPQNEGEKRRRFVRRRHAKNDMEAVE